MTEDEKILRGERAQELVDNPLLKKAIAAIKQQIFEDWEEAENEEVRNELWRQQKAVTTFEGILLGAIETGKVARQQLHEKNVKRRF